MLEFVLVGIAMIFMLICLFEVSRGLWAYHTLAYATREGTRYASMHGVDCATPNTCLVNIGQIVTSIKSAGGGFDPDHTTLTFTSQSGAAASDTMTNLASSTTKFPPSTAYGKGETITISAVWPFRSILAILWPGAGRGLNDSQTVHLGVSSTEQIQF
jgi:Flp pilus assembly protein TadG